MWFDFRKSRPFPMLLCVTHAKAGSMWLDGILRSLLGPRVFPLGYGEFSLPVHPGRAATAFLTRAQFEARPELAGTQRLIVIRDLRDTLVSRYFSLRLHEEDPRGEIAAERAALRGLSKEAGLRRLMHLRGMATTAEIQRSWLDADETIYRYEDLIRDDLNGFRHIFLERLELSLSASQVERAVRANRFETKYGRRLGQEDRTSHGRKGTPGDWRNHFTPALAEEFDEQYGRILLASGCERDPRWWRAVSEPAHLHAPLAALCQPA